MSEFANETASLARPERRSFLTRALGLGAGALGLSFGREATQAQAAPLTDADILNFSLNFEYLGAEFYTRGLTGQGIVAAGIPVTGSGTLGPTIVKPSPKVAFDTPMLKQFFAELANDEQEHVVFVRSTIQGLGARPIAKPTIDLLNSFNTASQLAGLGDTFDPYANETNFLLGAYILEDVCVTALRGAAPLIKHKTVLSGAAGLLGVEAYQAGAIRTLLFQRNQGTATRAISIVRAVASGAPDDYGVAVGPLARGPIGNTSIVLADPLAIAFARSFRQVLNIAYLTPYSFQPGGFFPNAVNGAIQ